MSLSTLHVEHLRKELASRGESQDHEIGLWTEIGEWLTFEYHQGTLLKLSPILALEKHEDRGSNQK